MPDDPTFRLVDLLAQQELGLRLVTEGNPETPILGAHAIEIEKPARWMKPGWLMLTTGARFGGAEESTEQQRLLVRELVAAEIAGLAFGVGIFRDAVPSALVEEAERCGLPVLSVPLATPFLEVIDVVHRATSTADVYRERRAVRIQDHLLESLVERDALSAVVHRLAELLRGTVVLYDQSGTILASAGVGPTQIIRSELGGPPSRRRFAVGRWQVLADPIRTDAVLHWLAVASRRRSLFEELAEPAMEAATRVLTMIVRSREAVRTEDRLRRRELLRMVTTGAGAESRYVWDRLEMHGFRRGDELRIVALAEVAPTSTPRSGSHDATEGVRTALLREAATDAGVPMLLETDEDRVLALVAAGEGPLQQWWEAVPSTAHGGLSEPFQDMSVGPARRRQAELALTSSLRGGPRLLPFEKINLLDWLIAGQDPASARAKAHDVLAPLIERPPLLQALEGYLRTDCDVGQTARELGLHPNSVRYRLRQVSASTGRNLRSPADLAELALSVRLLTEDR